MSDHPVIISGGGIAGLAMALTLHQIGVAVRVIESSRQMRPLGVGINVQPNAVRELFDMGLTSEALDQVGVPALEWALVGLNGKEVYSEPRGLDAGYHWPQYAAHRGKLLMLLYRTVLERLGHESIVLGHSVTGYQLRSGQSVLVKLRDHDGVESELLGGLL